MQLDSCFDLVGGCGVEALDESGVVHALHASEHDEGGDSDRDADGRWFGNMPEPVIEIRGEAAERLIPRIRAAVAAYA